MYSTLLEGSSRNDVLELSIELLVPDSDWELKELYEDSTGMEALGMSKLIADVTKSVEDELPAVWEATVVNDEYSMPS